ncbi:hypothetical protein J7W19_05665 [Streptomyces mobaraensis NBRC 13819 = DSM 40847]|uniref:Uncharacterized protein n=2 Tax=Streptomyces mobaraensis TaxID=35621 RepID=A0A5N5VZX2_STRMB|nr:hypothetical protein [Streptomyces mobaraensis]EMF00127.1 hypothetical protein H340_13172 [Streptomyces mobaraensis NBRC 13819 = DSM 40847]KAB7834515.1 hypothetical protein FRZ00_29705 [Streptomyces mobaraensis]QTT72980.1 hypothetical protein J7W19_05665 [Streptomyces mobaraensis NBRC 13819 = DSM 40847]
MAVGALLTYVWAGFTQAADSDAPFAVAVTGNAVFGAGALVLARAAVRSVRRHRADEDAGGSAGPTGACDGAAGRT